jgi:threonine/homoserine/homoserine lactone efflux protein
VWRDLAAFAVAFAVSAALPGPDTMPLFSRALSGGARAAGTVAVGLTAAS